MNEPENDIDVLTAEELAAQRVMRSLREPAADPDFRARLRAEFVAGTIGLPAPRVVHLRWFERESTRWAGAALAAAASIVAVVMVNQGPAWQLRAIHGDGVAVVDGRPVPMGHTSDFASRLRPGVRVQLPLDSDLEMQSEGLLAMQVAAGTDFTVPAPPGRWFWRETRADVNSGEVRITTAPRFHGSSLALTTPEARVMVTGTTLAVICEPEGTCVCVLEGVVGVAGNGQPMVHVEQGHRRYIFTDGRPAESAAIRDAEIGKLGELRDSERGAMDHSAH